MKLPQKHSNTKESYPKESHDSLLQVDGSGDGDLSCGGVVGGTAMSASRRERDAAACQLTQAETRGRGFKTPRPRLFFISQKLDLFMFLYLDSQTLCSYH